MNNYRDVEGAVPYNMIGGVVGNGLIRSVISEGINAFPTIWFVGYTTKFHFLLDFLLNTIYNNCKDRGAVLKSSAIKV